MEVKVVTILLALVMQTCGSVIEIPVMKKLTAERYSANMARVFVGDGAAGYEHEVELENYLNSQYYGTLYLGSEQEPFEFIFDTGSPWLWTATHECGDGCHTSDLFDTSASSTFKALPYDEVTLDYDVAQAAGTFG